MTAKDKARGLIDTYYNEVRYMERAKQCALIAVDEILDVIDNFEMIYWQEVKSEIEKL